MKNKYAPYLLAPVLILVWGLVFYRIYKAVYGEEEVQNTAVKTRLKDLDSNSVAVKYELSLAYDDPFALSASYSEWNEEREIDAPNPIQQEVIFPKSASVIQPNKENITLKPAVNPSTVFPEITFQGVQIHQNDTVGLVKLAGRFYPNVRAGQEIGKIKVLSITNEELLVQFGEEQKIIKR